MQLDGRIWISVDNKPFLGMGRVKLLKLIDQTGSISKAAKELKMSYKAAWQMIDSMNNIAKNPLVERVSGGSGGGGTVVTDDGKELINSYEMISAKHRELTKFLSSEDLEHILNKTQKITLRTSARNQFWGKIVSIDESDLMSEIKVEINKELFIYTRVTKKSKNSMNLTIGSEVYLLIKANFIELNSSYKNSFKATIKDIKFCKKESELELEIAQDFLLVALVRSDGLSDLMVGEKIDIAIDPDNIIIGI